MTFTHRLEVVYIARPPLPQEDPQTYWATADECVQLVDDILSHDEDAVDGPRVAFIRITCFGETAGLVRKHVYDETGY